MNVRKSSRTLKSIMLMMALSLVFLAGCQAVGGVDFNTVLKQTLKVDSVEGKSSVELKLLLNEEPPEWYSEEDLAAYKLFSHAKLELNDIKTQDEEHFSMNGRLLFGEQLDTEIGFKLAASDSTLVLELDGAKQPFVIDISDPASGLLGGGYYNEDGEDEGGPSEESLTAIGNQIVDAFSEFTINNLPNPENLSVTSVKEPINGESTSLYLAKAELSGHELWAWLKDFVDALADDQEGIAQLAATVIEALQSDPAVWDTIGMGYYEGMLDAPTDEDMIQEFKDSISFMLSYIQDSMAEAEEEGEDGSSLDDLFNENTYLKADMYIDKKLHVRKENIELSVRPQGEDFDSSLVKGFVLNLSSENWNINGNVKAEEAVAPENAVSFDELAMGPGYAWLQQFEEDSVIYDILKNKMHLGVQEVYLYTDDYQPPIVTPAGVTIIPLRYTAEELGAEVSYDSEANKYTVYDEATGTTIELQKGSKVVTINGQKVNWQFPVTAVDDALYVPARDLAVALGATLHWETYYEDEYGSYDMLVINREV